MGSIGAPGAKTQNSPRGPSGGQSGHVPRLRLNNARPSAPLVFFCALLSSSKPGRLRVAPPARLSLFSLRAGEVGCVRAGPGRAGRAASWVNVVSSRRVGSSLPGAPALTGWGFYAEAFVGAVAVE